jgi:acetylornithine deacetylase/succinyl-diaminopimelate desuccinylase-like protein
MQFSQPSGYNPVSMETIDQFRARLRPFLNWDRLVETAVRLISVPSPTGEAGRVADVLAQMFAEDGFAVERPEAGHARAPAVVVRLDSDQEGRTLQFNGHLDTVHLPFVPPRVEDGRITGSGASDMKAGIAAAVEALRVLRDSGLLRAGSVLFTAHDLHEAPWGLGQQVDGLIQEGIVGDAVLIPEPLCDRLPVVGRGLACWKVTIRRAGPPVHEVMRPPDEPNVIAVGAELVARLRRLDNQLAAQQADPLAGLASVFIGQIHSGEIYNQAPRECWLEGTRRWLPGTCRHEVEREFRALLDGLVHETRAMVDLDYSLVRDAFFLDQNDPFVSVFQQAYQAISDHPLPIGPKPFVDDGNSFWALGGKPAITHGPRAGGQHTVHEWVSIDDLARVAYLYSLMSILYCKGSSLDGN